MSRILLLSPTQARRTLTRLAFEIVERNRGGENLTIFGIRRRGVGLAEDIARQISEIVDMEVDVHSLDVTPFRDDLESPPPIEPLDPPPTVAGRDVVVVDDVLFTGRTVRAAIDAVLHYGRPASLQLAVLIDRGHRELPIRPDFVGREVPTKHRERVEVELEPQVSVFLDEG